jgi:hypothetical protein
MEGATRTGAPAELRPRLVELVAAQSLAADLGLGQAMEHGLRACLIATRLADRLGLDERTRDDVLLGEPAGDGRLRRRFL